MALQLGQADGLHRYQNLIRKAKLDSYVRSHKMTPQEADRRYTAAQKINYKLDPNYMNAAMEYGTVYNSGKDSTLVDLAYRKK